MRNLLGYGCRRHGLHVARTKRLLIVSGRASDYWRSFEVADDDEIMYWQGYRPDHVSHQHTPPVAWQPIRSDRDVILPMRHYLYFSAICRKTYSFAGDLQITGQNDVYNIGGNVREAFRGKGYGSEMLRQVCHMAHRHFGIARLIAGFEDVNVKSRRWLASGGFTPTDGPATYTLPNGREAPTCWVERTDPKPTQRCWWLTDEGRMTVGFRVSANPDPNDFVAQANTRFLIHHQH